MECDKANTLMMKFMDNDMILTDIEQQTLNEHLLVCSVCNEDYSVYKQLVEQFADGSALLEAPEGFEERVMKRVMIIKSEYAAIPSTEAATGFALGVFVITIGLSIVLSSYGIYIIDAASGYPLAYNFCVGTSNVFDAIAMVFNNAALGVLSLINGFINAVENIQHGALAVTIILFVMQYAVRFKAKSRAGETVH